MNGYVNINNQPIAWTSRWPARNLSSFSDLRRTVHSLLKIDGAKVAGASAPWCSAQVAQFESATRPTRLASPPTAAWPSPTRHPHARPEPDRRLGKLSLVKYHNVDTSSACGPWITHAPAQSPWNTCSSPAKKYEPDPWTTDGRPGPRSTLGYATNARRATRSIPAEPLPVTPACRKSR